MFGLAALIAALTMSGAPATTPVTCSPTAFAGEKWGFAYPARIIPGGPLQPLTNISLYGPVGCAAVLFASATAAERVKIIKLNPGVNFAQVIGQGLLVDLHESAHVGLDSRDECLVERQAAMLYPSFIARFSFGSRFVSETQPYEVAYNTFILATYLCT